MMTTLSFGACICIPSESDRINRLTSFLYEAKVTIATLTSTIASLVEPQDTPMIRTMILTGEAVQAKVVDRWIQQATVINAYGPSEASIWATAKKIQSSGEATNIGTPLAGGFWVVNPASVQLVPIGTPGELLIEGPLLAREYLDDADKTAAAFVTDPEFLQELGLGLGHGRRMYRTGDLVQQNVDRSMTYLGRRDTQVKIRGQRVEIGEIEYYIGKQAGVHEAVVLYMHHGSLAGRLVAAVVLGESSAISSTQDSEVRRVPDSQKESARVKLQEVQHDLSQHVMHYMVPNVWIPLAIMPMNASGKTDRLALTRWVQSLPPDDIDDLTRSEEADDAANDYSATPVERQLRQIWSEVLDVPLRNVTYTSNFFSLGGDSITAMQVVSSCRACGISVTVNKVLERQTIQKLAADAHMGKDTGFTMNVPEGYFSLSPIQQMYFEDMAADGLRADGEYRFNQGVSLHVTNRIEIAELSRALEKITTKHAMLRARFRYNQKHGWQQCIQKDPTESYRIRAHKAVDIHSMQKIIIESQSSLNLEHGPVFAADLIERCDRQNKQVLHLVAHHLIIDIVSWRILIRDLEELIVHHKLPNPSSLSFPTWLDRQRELLSKSVSEFDTLADALPVAVPKSGWEYWGLTPGQVIYASVSRTQVKCNSAITSLLTGRANDAFKTEPVEILLASLLVSFQQVFTDRSAPVVFTEGHGRETTDEETDLSDTIGWFTTMTPVYVRPDSNNPIDVLRQVKDQRRRVPGRGLPYFSSRFLTARGKEAFAGHSPAEIMFNYLGRFQQLERADALFHIDDEAASATSHFGSLTKLFAALDVSVSVEASELCINVSFSRQLQHQPAIRQWITSYANTITSIVEELATTAPIATATDFPHARLSDGDMVIVEKQYLAAIGISSMSDIEDILPCSPIQQGILLTQLQSPLSYCIHQTCRIIPSSPGSTVIASRVAASWRQVVARHTILRTILLEPLPGRERFMQIVIRQPEIDIFSVDGIADEAISEWFSSQPRLDLSNLRRPPHRLTLVTTTSSQVYCRFDISHALVDASSMALLVRDLISAYEGDLPDGDGSKYSAYITYLEGEGRQRQDDLQYWKTLLNNAELCLLPPENPLHDASQAQLAKVSTRIEDLTPLHQFRDTHGVSMASICQLSWALVLALRTGSLSSSFGNLSNGRDVPIHGVQELVGPMINMLVCHLPLDWNARVSDVARKLQSQSAEAFEHQRASLASIQHELGLSRDRPLFNTTLSYKRQAPGNSRPVTITLEV
jgi:non-ribosomal peptide synthase protein (TIGR01720 family)